MEEKIGTRFTIEVVESENDSCEGCFFYLHDFFRCDDLSCKWGRKKGEKNFIYKEVRNESCSGLSNCYKPMEEKGDSVESQSLEAKIQDLQKRCEQLQKKYDALHEWKEEIKDLIAE